MKQEILHRVVTFLDRKELDFLDAICKDILFSKGIKIPRSVLLKNLVDIFVVSKTQEVKNYQDLIKLILNRN